MFPDVLLSDSFVLDWSCEGDRFIFSIEMSLWPGHPNYEDPRPEEWTCYKPGRLVFEGVQSVEGLPEPSYAPCYTDATGSNDFGNVLELTSEPSGYRLAGDFGVVAIKADSVRLDIGDSSE